LFYEGGPDEEGKKVEKDGDEAPEEAPECGDDECETKCLFQDDLNALYTGAPI
jgi:hypothetical protein